MLADLHKLDEYSTTVNNNSNNNTHPFNGPLSGTTRVSRYQKGKTNLDFTEARDSEWHGISWAVCKSAHRSRQITTPAPHHSATATTTSRIISTSSRDHLTNISLRSIHRAILLYTTRPITCTRFTARPLG